MPRAHVLRMTADSRVGRVRGWRLPARSCCRHRNQLLAETTARFLAQHARSLAGAYSAVTFTSASPIDFEHTWAFSEGFVTLFESDTSEPASGIQLERAAQRAANAAGRTSSLSILDPEVSQIGWVRIEKFGLSRVC